MKVADLAADLEVPASTILDQCQRFGIDASWSGAELRSVDVAVLRAELAMADPLDLTEADPPAGPVVVPTEGESGDEPSPEAPSDAAAAPDPVAATEADEAADAPTAPVPVAPTAVGSMPDLLTEITPEPEPDVPGPHPSPFAGAAGGAGAAGSGGNLDANGVRRVSPRPAPDKRRLEKCARNSLFALVIAVACFAASNATDLAAVVAVLWVLTAVALGVAVFDGIRGRRRVQTHPDRVHGLWLASISLVLACGGLVGLTAAAFTAVSDSPAADAPAGLGDLRSVQAARWGYQRVHRFADNGWNQPARSEGSCWVEDASRPRDEQRVEQVEASDGKSCNATHTLQAMKVFAVNRDADAPYPGAAKLLELGQEECAVIVLRLAEKGVDFTMEVEYPTEIGWNDGDHDVACVAVTPPRTAPLGT